MFAPRFPVSPDLTAARSPPRMTVMPGLPPRNMRGPWGYKRGTSGCRHPVPHRSASAWVTLAAPARKTGPSAPCKGLKVRGVLPVPGLGCCDGEETRLLPAGYGSGHGHDVAGRGGATEISQGASRGSSVGLSSPSWCALMSVGAPVRGTRDQLRALPSPGHCGSPPWPAGPPPWPR